MPFDDTEDLAAMFDEGDFAYTATLAGVAAGNVIEDREYLLALGMLSTNEIGVMALASAYDTGGVGSLLVYNGGTYKIRACRAIPPDGKVVMLQLETQ